MEVERAINQNISLYPKQIKKVEKYAGFKKYNSISRAYQEIIDFFFNEDDKDVKYDFLLFLVVPLMFVVLTTIVNLSTGKVYDILTKQGLFFDELYFLSRVFTIMSFGSIGILIACVYWLRRKLIERNSFKQVITDGD